MGVSVSHDNEIEVIPTEGRQKQPNNNPLFQHQSSVTSMTSVQTVLHQTIPNPNVNPASFMLTHQSCPSGSLNSLLHQTNSSNVSSAEEALNIADVADLLHPQHAIITGGRSRDGCPLIIFPDNNYFHTLEDVDYQKLILYLTSVPSMQDVDLGFNLIIDRRKDRWTAVKAVLLKISVYFPAMIHIVYVLRPSGFLQKAISEVSSKFFKEEFRFRLVICSSLDDLYDHIDKSQLTQDMGGDLVYSHHEWIQQRISLEKFSSLTHQVSADLDVFIQAIHDTEFPNSVESTQKLLDEQGREYERLKDEILSAAKHGEELLYNLKSRDELKEFSERTGHVSANERAGNINRLIVQPHDDTRDYRRLLVQLEETERRFDEFWNIHLARLKQCLELRRFEQDFRELQANFDSHLKTVSEMTEIGETVTRVDTLIKETKAFQKICQTDIERAEEVISAGQQLVGIRGAYPKEVVQPKCDELLRVCDIINERLTRRLDTLSKSRELMERVEKANKWCAKGIELLASQRIEKCSVSAELAEQSLQEIQQFISSASEFKLSSPREFKNIFQESTTPETKALVTQVLQRIDDVSLMCDKRVASLKKLTLKPPRPVQTVTPEPAVPLQPPGGAPHLFRRRNQSKNRNLRVPPAEYYDVRQRENRSHNREQLCQYPTLDIDKNESWLFKSKSSDTFTKVGGIGVRTRASRIEQIERQRYVKSNSGDLRQYCDSVKEVGSGIEFGAGSPGVVERNGNRQGQRILVSDIDRISQMFEEVRRESNTDNDKNCRNRLSLAPTTVGEPKVLPGNGSKIKRLVDNYENKCNCKKVLEPSLSLSAISCSSAASSLSSSSSTASSSSSGSSSKSSSTAKTTTSISTDTLQDRHHSKPKFPVHPPLQRSIHHMESGRLVDQIDLNQLKLMIDDRCNDRNDRVNHRIKNMFEMDRNDSNQSVEDEHDYNSESPMALLLRHSKKTEAEHKQKQMQRLQQREQHRHHQQVQRQQRAFNQQQCQHHEQPLLGDHQHVPQQHKQPQQNRPMHHRHVDKSQQQFAERYQHENVIEQRYRHRHRQPLPSEFMKCSKTNDAPPNTPTNPTNTTAALITATDDGVFQLRKFKIKKQRQVFSAGDDKSEPEPYDDVITSGSSSSNGKSCISSKQVEPQSPTTTCMAVIDKLEKKAQKDNDKSRNKTSCGYMNCTYLNCPMSLCLSSPTSFDDCKEVCRKNKNIIDCGKSYDNFEKKDNISESKRVERNGLKIMMNTVANDKSRKEIIASKSDDEHPSESSLAHDRYNDLNDLQNFSGKNLIKATTDEVLLSPNLSLNNTVKKGSMPKADIDVNLKNNENRKFNDLKSGNSSHCLKIFVRNPTASTSSCKGSVGSDTCSLTDSEKDYDYYDHVPESIASTERAASSNSKRSSDAFGQNNAFSPKLGCDGAIFWNNCYFYEDNYCLQCTDNNSGYKNDETSQTFQCICTTKKADTQDVRPRSLDAGMDSGISLNGGDNISSPDSDISSQHLQNQPDSESRRLKRGHVLSELLETERIYVSEMSSILKGYRNPMMSDELAHLVPASLQGKEDILFGNLHELYTFHNDIFLKDLENCISTTELVALCFVQRRDTFYRLYSFYCQNIPRSDRLRETLVDTHLFLQECQKRLGHKLPLAAYLLKPVQRITKYQLLLKDLLRFSDSGTCAKELQKALDCMLIVLKCVNDSMHQIAITGFPADLSQQGELLLQDSFQVWTESKKDIRLRLKPQQRHIFLYQKAMLFCKQGSKTGHNKSTYQFKHYLKMSQIGLTESVRGDTKRFEVWLQGRQEVHTLQAPTEDIKKKWVAEIKRVLLNQLEELKGEKAKQYGMNHKPLRQAASWDTPPSAISTPQRTLSCDTSESNRNSNGSDDCPSQIPGISCSSSERDNQDVSGWSSDYSNSEDELSMIEDNSIPGSKFIALADYCAVGHSEVSMKEGDFIELLKIGCAGWWFVKILDTNAEGWTPAAYLEPINRKSSRSSSRNQDRISSER